MQQIAKIDAISYNEFMSSYLKPGIPVVLSNASTCWKSIDQFNPSFFRKHFGKHITVYKGTTYSMSDILDITEQSTPENPAPYPILFEVPIQLPEFMQMLNPIHMNYAFPNWFRSKIMPYGKFGNSVHLFIGGVGNQYGLHKDMYHTNAWVTQLYGEKKFVVFPREQEELLYPQTAKGADFISPINILKPDYEMYPKYKYATPLSIVLKQGETIFIPNGIWHTTVASGHNISLILDQLNSYNFKAWKRDMYNYAKEKGKIRAVAKYSLAQILGLVCKMSEMTGNKF